MNAVPAAAHHPAPKGGASPNPNGVIPWAVEHLDIPHILASPPPEHRWTWDGYIERGTLTVLHGDGGTGKSILGGHLARAVTTGGTCLGRNTTKGRVLILDAENPMDEIARRMHGLDYASTPPGAIAYYRAAEAVFGTAAELDLEPLATMIELHQADVVILDSQRGLWGGEEKDALEIRPLYRQLQYLAEQYDVAIIIVHHDRRIGGFSGSSDIHNSADTRLWLERPDPDKPERVLHHAKARSSAELQPAAYTFTFDQQLGLFTFTQPREPITDAGMVMNALDDAEWRTYPEVADRAGMRQAETKSILWELVRAGTAQSITGIPGRSKRSIGFRRTDSQQNSSQTWDESGRVAQIALPAHSSPAFTPPLGGEAGRVDAPDSSRTLDELSPRGDDIPF